MTTQSAACTRRAITRLATPEVLPAPGATRPARYRWLRISLRLPAAVDSRDSQTVVSTSLETTWTRVLDIAGLVAAATGAAAFLAAVCR